MWRDPAVHVSPVGIQVVGPTPIPGAPEYLALVPCHTGGTRMSEELRRCKGVLGRMQQFLELGHTVGGGICFDLGSATPLRRVVVRNRTVPGKAEVEERALGCAVQLLDEDRTVLQQVVFDEVAIEYTWASASSLQGPNERKGVTA